MKREAASNSRGGGPRRQPGPRDMPGRRVGVRQNSQRLRRRLDRSNHAQWSGVVDPFRTLVQVKATRSPSGLRSPGRIRVDRAHALRWSRMREAVLVVRWDLSSRRGWYLLPKQTLDFVDLLRRQRKTVTLKFPESQPFDENNAERIAWDLRLKHQETRLLAARNEDLQAALHKWADNAGHRLPSGQAAAVLVETFMMLGVLEDHGLAGWFLRSVNRARRELVSMDRKLPPNERADAESLAAQTLLLAFLRAVKRAGGHGTPPLLAQECCESLMILADPRLQGEAKQRRHRAAGARQHHRGDR